MWIEAVTFFLGVSILFYCLFGGADFGAGILEIFRGPHYRKEQQDLITHAMGPVWEANHMWLVLAVVILFNGFPRAYSTISTLFHIPLTFVLIGVILRGCSFTFRHYDAVQDASQKTYSTIFALSSVLTPFMLGVVAGASLLGKTAARGSGFSETYVYPWLNPFSFATGFFTCVLFSFLAAVYLIGEAENGELRKIFTRRAQVLNALAVVSGVVVFATAAWDGLDLLTLFWSKPLSLTCMILATLGLIPLWICLDRSKTILSRVLAGGQILLILVGWLKIQFPVILHSQTGESLTLYNSAAPTITLQYLFYALAIGSFAIFPALFFLLKIFKVNSKPIPHSR